MKRVKLHRRLQASLISSFSTALLDSVLAMSDVILGVRASVLILTPMYDRKKPL